MVQTEEMDLPEEEERRWDRDPRSHETRLQLVVGTFILTRVGHV